ncbi:hypothetical protein KCU81_g5039, partial [Aureobasidium melanogenum]|uniref:Uncharacterized protein n=1 Tax=Aureobasidium melanogenum (strain CBS 110374) TaxID=1043003 RepID=A0A074VF31_AURM1
MLSAIAAVVFLGKKDIASQQRQSINLLPKELYLSFTPSSRPVYASVDPEGLPDIYHTFLERPLQPILSRDHREEYSKSSLTVALRYGEPVSESSNALSQSSGDTARVATESTRTHEAESPEEAGLHSAVRFQLESPMATISSSYSEWLICLRCEDMLEKVNLLLCLGRLVRFVVRVSQLPASGYQVKSAVGLVVACTP